MKLYPLQGELPYELLLLADETEEAINKYIHACDVFTLDENNETIGVVAVQKLGGKVVEIKNLAVSKDHQKKGYGSKMIDWVKAHCLKQYVKEILVGTGDASVGQLLFYQKCGFEIHTIRKSFFIDNYKEPIYENGVRLKHMIVLKMEL